MQLLRASRSRRWLGIAALIQLLAISLACGSSGSTTDPAAPAPPAPAVAPHATETIFCVHPATDNSCTSSDSTTRFTADVPMIHGSTTIEPVPPAGSTVHITWIAESVSGDTPPHTTITSSDFPVQQMEAGAVSITVDYSLSQPTAGWPVGSYRVTVELNGQLLATGAFEIAAS